MNRKRAQELVTDWMSGEISARELQRLKDYLEEHPTFRAEVNKMREAWEDLENLDQDGYGAPYMGPALERKLQEASSNPTAADHDSNSSDTTCQCQTVPGRRADTLSSSNEISRTRSRKDQLPSKRIITVTSAALLVLFASIYVLFVLQFSDSDWTAQITATSSGVKLIRGTQQLEVREGIKIRSGDVLQVPGNASATLSYRNENTSVTVRDDAKFRLRSEENKKYISLEHGSLEVDLAEQEGRDKLVVSTNDARARAIGTSFRIGHEKSTRLEVSDGRVHVSSLTSNDAKRIEKREYARVKQNGDVVSGDVFTGWVEEFTDLTDGSMSDDGRTAWEARTAQGEGGNGFSVSDGAVHVNTTKERGGLESGGVWTSEEIDISGADKVNVSVDFGGLECAHDDLGQSKSAGIEFELRVAVDGGEPKKIVGLSGAPQTPGIGVNGLSGSTLKLQIAAVNHGGPECFSLDRVSVLPE